MTVESLSSSTFDLKDESQALEFCHQRGWTDGLPVIPPTEERVRRMLAGAGREPGEVLGTYEERFVTITVEKCAINAVMAGCLPEYFPVVLAIVEGILAQGGMMAVQVSTGGPSVGFIINGPIRNALGMNYRGDVLGPGNRANSSIGRAVRLIQRNAFGSVGGAGYQQVDGRLPLDRATVGHPARHICYHIPENEEDFPELNPLHVDLGFKREQSVATVFDVSDQITLSAHAEETPEDIIKTFAHHIVAHGRFRPVVTGEVHVVAGVTGGGVCTVVLPPEVAGHFVHAKWSKADFRKALFESITRSGAWLKQTGNARGPVGPADEKTMYAAVAKAEHIFPVIAGGPAGAFVPVLFPYVGYHASRVIRIP